MIQIIDHGPVRELRLDRPPANALNPELIAALRGAVAAAPGEGARALVLSGSPRMLSGGLDLPALIHFDRAAMAELWAGFYDLMRVLAGSPVPIAAAVTGHAPAGGAVLSLFGDTRIMAEGDFRIGLNEVQVGIKLPPIIYKVLRRLVGPHQAERLAVSGQLVPAAEALRIGLVDELVPHGQVVERAVQWCQGILALPPQAMSGVRREARADLVALFAGDTRAEMEQVLGEWFSEESQRVMGETAARLGKGKG